MEVNLDRIEYLKWVENVLFRLVSYEHFFELSSNNKNHFWSMVQNSLGESVCIFWCHIFGNRSDDLHYSNFFNSETENIGGKNFSLPIIKSRLLKAIEMDDSAYSKFWNEVKTCRDQFIAHKEIGVSIKFPRIDLCRIQAEELRNIMKEFVSIALKKGVEGNWDLWNRYYQASINSNHSIKIKCENDFKSGILSVSKKYG